MINKEDFYLEDMGHGRGLRDGYNVSTSDICPKLYNHYV